MGTQLRNGSEAIPLFFFRRLRFLLVCSELMWYRGQNDSNVAWLMRFILLCLFCYFSAWRKVRKFNLLFLFLMMRLKAAIEYFSSQAHAEKRGDTMRLIDVLANLHFFHSRSRNAIRTNLIAFSLYHRCENTDGTELSEYALEEAKWRRPTTSTTA